MYTKGAGSPVALAFINFIISPDYQSTKVSAVGFLPLSTTSAQAAVDS
jgi:ABC-type phosphate transport system substrate-binding protein